MSARPLYWKLTAGKIAVPCTDIVEWARWRLANFDKGIVAKTHIGAVHVSTIFLGLDHRWGDGDPLIFETMIFRGGKSAEQWRHSSWQEAEEHHNAVAAAERAKIKERVNE